MISWIYMQDTWAWTPDVGCCDAAPSPQPTAAHTYLSAIFGEKRQRVETWAGVS